MSFDEGTLGSDVTETLISQVYLGSGYYKETYSILGSDYADEMEIVYYDGYYGVSVETLTAGNGGRVALYVGDLDASIEDFLDGLPSLLSGADRVYGASYSDRLLGFSGSDVMLGNGGNDSIYGFSGNDRISGGRGADLTKGGGGDDVIRGGAGSDRLVGQAGNDRLYGQAGNDTIKGGGSSDLIKGGKGDDLLFGNGGRDTFVFAKNDGTDRIRNFRAEKDLIRLKGADDASDFQVRQVGDDVRVKYGSTTIIVEDTDLGFFLGEDPFVF